MTIVSSEAAEALYCIAAHWDLSQVFDPDAYPVATDAALAELEFMGYIRKASVSIATEDSWGTEFTYGPTKDGEDFLLGVAAGEGILELWEERRLAALTIYLEGEE